MERTKSPIIPDREKPGRNLNIAVIGAGISGLVTAYVLGQRHNVTVFESADYAGGHANTVSVRDETHQLNIDTGFIVFNESNYPLLCRLFSALNVQSTQSNMSFSVVCEKSKREYNGENLNSLFAQRSNVFRTDFWRMLIDILRFNRTVSRFGTKTLAGDLTVGQYVSQQGYSSNFIDQYLVPLGSSLWSCSSQQFKSFPIRFVVEFLENHGMLKLANRPTWLTVTGGSQQYVKKITNRIGGKLFTETAARKIYRQPRSIEVELANGYRQTFDEVVLATHADTSLQLLASPDDIERETLEAFPYQDNHVCLHTDTRVLPNRKPAWASWNYRIPANDLDPVSVTYNMNRLQALDVATTYCVSLNQIRNIAPEKIIQRITYRHPVFGGSRDIAQRNHQHLIRKNRISYCGAYWGNGFHEDGIRSSLTVAKAFDIEPPF